MRYLSCRLHRQASINISEVINLWKDLAQDIDEVGEFTWKIWQITQVLSSEDDVQLYNIDAQNQYMVVKTSPCYLRAEQRMGGITFTILSSEERALGSVRSLIENICAPVKPVRLDESLSRNEYLLVQAAKLYKRDDNSEVSFTLSQPVALHHLLANWPSSTPLSLSVIVNRETPPMNMQRFYIDMNVRMLYINTVDHQIGFSVETDLLEENVLIDRLFTMANGAFVD